MVGRCLSPGVMSDVFAGLVEEIVKNNPCSEERAIAHFRNKFKLNFVWSEVSVEVVAKIDKSFKPSWSTDVLVSPISAG